MKKHKLGLVIVFLTLAALLMACGDEPTESPKRTEFHSVGEGFVNGDWAIVVTSFEKTNDSLGYDFGKKTTATGTWMVVTVDMRNETISAKTVDFNDFAIEDSAGRKFPLSQDIAVRSYSGYSGFTPLTKEITPKGIGAFKLIFDIPTDSKGDALIYKKTILISLI